MDQERDSSLLFSSCRFVGFKLISAVSGFKSLHRHQLYQWVSHRQVFQSGYVKQYWSNQLSLPGFFLFPLPSFPVLSKDTDRASLWLRCHQSSHLALMGDSKSYVYRCVPSSCLFSCIFLIARYWNLFPPMTIRWQIRLAVWSCFPEKKLFCPIIGAIRSR